MLRTMSMLRTLRVSLCASANPRTSAGTIGRLCAAMTLASLLALTASTHALAQPENPLLLGEKQKDVPPPLPPGPGIPVTGKDGRIITLQINNTKTIGMTRAPGATEDPIIQKVLNENPKIVRVNAFPNDPRKVKITGITPGRSKIVFTGYTDKDMKDLHDETFDIEVTSDEDEFRVEQRKKFLELIRQTAPLANIDVVVAGPTGANTIFITGNVQSHETVQQVLETARAIFGQTVNIVNGMRVGGVQQVEVDVVICSINRSKARTMTFNWSINRPDFFLSSILNATNFTANVNTIPITTVLANQTTTGGNIVFGSLTNSGAFFGFLQALRTDGLAKLQAEPKVVTLSGRPAQFVSGGETPILTQTGLGGPSVAYRTFGTTITVLPIVLGNGKIHLEIAPLVSQINAANGVTIAGANGSTVVPGFDTQGAQVAIQCEDGQTVAIGGLIQHVTSGTAVKVPVLGDMPFVGAAFRSVSYSDKENELIILVTPRLIDPMGCDQLPPRYLTRQTRSPDDFELYLEGLLELPRGQRQTCSPNGCYVAPHLNERLGFPCNDASGACGPGVLRGHNHLLGNGCGTGACSTGACNTGCTTGACSTGACSTGTCGPKSYTALPPASTLQTPPSTVRTPLTEANQPVSGIAPAPRDAAPMSPPLPPARLPSSANTPVSYNAVPADLPVATPALRLPNIND